MNNLAVARRQDVDYAIENIGEALGETSKILLRRLYNCEITIDEFDEKIKNRVGTAVMVLGSLEA